MSFLTIIQRIIEKRSLMKKVLLCLSGILLFIFMSVTAQAYIFSQPPYTEAGGLISSSGDPLMGDPSPRVYDDFTLTTSSAINTIVWWGLSYFGDPQFTYTVYNDSDNSPGSVFYSSTGAPTRSGYTTTNGQLIDMYSITLGSSFTAAAGTKYWLSIYNTETDSLWGWDIAAYGNGSIESEDYGTNGEFPVYYDLQLNPHPFQPGGTSNVAFQLDYVPVPEPSVILLLGLGLIGVAIISRRKIDKAC